jgi:AcrR family transcriptional regulator
MSSTPLRRSDPLTEILLRPTTGAAVPTQDLRDRAASIASHPAAPRTRAGSGLGRSRAAIVDGARRAVIVSGTRVSMAQVAAAAGVAKATLYNHFRTREDVLEAVLLAEIDAVIADVGHRELSLCLIRAATLVSEHPLLEALGEHDTDVLAAMARVDVRSAGWNRVAAAIETVLSRSGKRGTPTVLRWLSSFVLAPADLEDIAADVAILVAGLPPR